MSERERVRTRNFRHPISALPVGTLLESPTGVPAEIVGRSQLRPGWIEVRFTPSEGREFVQHMWPAKLDSFKILNGRSQ
ncbi:MAG: hypothetical protein JO112_20205 [Planctomycetes bacterium]|nr:hypothetical protein [Planctomycetota bacterium]